MGLDCSTVKFGWGVVDCYGGRLLRVDSGVWNIKGKGKKGDPHPVRMENLEALLRNALSKYMPDAVLVESAFMGLNAQALIRIAEMRGVALLTTSRAGILAQSVAPSSMKKKIAGIGNAKKTAVAASVATLLGEPNEFASDDESDALALAIYGTFEE